MTVIHNAGLCIYFYIHKHGHEFEVVTPFKFVKNFNENIIWDVLYTFLFKPPN